MFFLRLSSASATAFLTMSSSSTVSVSVLGFGSAVFAFSVFLGVSALINEPLCSVGGVFLLGIRALGASPEIKSKELSFIVELPSPFLGVLSS